MIKRFMRNGRDLVQTVSCGWMESGSVTEERNQPMVESTIRTALQDGLKRIVLNAAGGSDEAAMGGEAGGGEEGWTPKESVLKWPGVQLIA
jgi:hypothetical protein